MISISFAPRLYLDTRKFKKNSVPKDAYHPIVLQIIFQKKVRRRQIGLSATFSQWDFENHEFKKGVHGRREKNDRIEAFEKKASDIYEKHFSKTPFNFKTFFELLEHGGVKKVKVAEFCRQVSQDFIKSDQANSSNDYKYLSNSILKISPKDLTFDEFTQEWLEQFEEFHTATGIKCYNHMVHLRALFNKAVKKKIADFKKNPFKNPYTNPYGYEFNHLKKRKRARVNKDKIKDLPKEYLVELMKYEPQTKNEAKYLAVWFFSFYNFGVNLTDIANLKSRDIKNGRWFYERSKTGVGLKKGKPLLPEALEIIEKYDTGKKYVFDILNGYDGDELTKANRIQYYASYIRKTCKKVSERLGFDGYFTFYSARYSSATLALNEGADRNTVSHLLDHENFSTIDNYAGRADDEKVVKAMQILRLG